MENKERHGSGHTPRPSSSGPNTERHGARHTPGATAAQPQSGTHGGTKSSTATSTRLSNMKHKTPRRKFRCHHPHFYREATLEYDKDQQYVHVDAFRTQHTGPEDDRYISPTNGSIRKLIVQSTHSHSGNSTYRRTKIGIDGGGMVSVANWALRRPHPTIFSWIYAIFRYIVGSITIGLFYIFSPARPRKHLNYDPFHYAHYTYAKVPRNIFEERPEHGSYQERDHSSESMFPPAQSKTTAPRNTRETTQRPLFPRWLCFLQNPGETDGQNHGVKVARVDQPETWPHGVKHAQHPEYVFVAYTTEQFRHSSEEDMQALDEIAETATRKAGLAAYWIGSTCFRDDEDDEDQVYWISDIVRCATVTCMAIGPSGVTRGKDDADLMREWGSRIWTLPEVLLSRANRPIVVVQRGDLDNMQLLPRTQFPAKVWDDGDESRRLIDHFEGTLHMSTLELMTTALQCLHRRTTRTKYFNGDHSYALMGLANIRPRPISSDSAFQAFARLSLANNSERLLERLICLLPKRSDQEWWTMTDAFGVNLWDIYPSIQVAGICGGEKLRKRNGNELAGSSTDTQSGFLDHHDDDAVIIDGMCGAAIRWKSFHLIQTTTGFSCICLLASCLFLFPFLLFIATLALGVASVFKHSIPINTATVALGVLFAISVLSSPFTMRKMFSEKIRKADPALFGIEGYMPLDDVERRVFGAAAGRLRWSPWATPISRHALGDFDECIGLDPTQDKEVQQMVEDAKKAEYGAQRIFTLVDTGTMTVTLFQAVRPPVGLLVCGSEGGMQRVLGVSYDWKTRTCFRETVFRMPTSILDDMLRVPKVKLGLKRKEALVRRTRT